MIVGATIGGMVGGARLAQSDDLRLVALAATGGAALMGLTFALRLFSRRSNPRLSPVLGRVVVTLAAIMTVVLTFNLLVATDGRRAPARPNAQATVRPELAAPAPLSSPRAPAGSVVPVAPESPRPAMHPSAATATPPAPRGTGAPASSPAATTAVAPLATPRISPPSPPPSRQPTLSQPPAPSPAQTVAPTTPQSSPTPAPVSIIPALPPLPAPTIGLP
jgi:hypothetical protein